MTDYYHGNLDSLTTMCRILIRSVQKFVRFIEEDRFKGTANIVTKHLPHKYVTYVLDKPIHLAKYLYSDNTKKLGTQNKCICFVACTARM